MLTSYCSIYISVYICNSIYETKKNTKNNIYNLKIIMMKHKFLNFLLLLMLLISAPRVVAADDPNDWTITTKLAGQAFTPATNLAFGSEYDGGYMLYQEGCIAKQFAVSNGVIYAITPGQPYWNNTANNQIEVYNSYGGFQTRTALDSGCEAYSSGRGIAADDNGNIIYAYSTNYVCKVGGIAVLKSSGEYGKAVSVESRKVIALGVYTHALRGANADWYGGTGRTDFFYASGNIYDGTGYMWFTDGVEVVRITIENVDGTQTATREDVYQIAGSGFVTPTGEYHESRIKPYGDNCFLLQNETGVYDCKLVDNVMQVVQVIRGTNYKFHASNIFNFHGHKILVLDTWENNNFSGVRDGQLSLYDMNQDDINTMAAASICYSFNAMTGTISGSESGTIGYENDVKFTELDGDGDGVEELADALNIDTWCEFELDPNQKQLHLYTYCQSVGFAKFTINAEGNLANPISQVTATLHKHDSHQDAMITWDPVSENHETTQYKVYYRRTPYTYGDVDNVQIDFDNYSSWVELGTTEAGVTEYTHSDVKYLNHETKFYKRTYQYKVVPADGVDYANNETLGEVTPEWISASPTWLTYQGAEGVKHYEGYQKVQLFWEYDGYGNQPTSYDVYRDGVKISEMSLQMFNFVDYNVSPGREHTYYVMANYDGMTIDGEPIEGGKSSEKTVLVTKRDEAKPQYQLDVIYNYEIGTGDGKVNLETPDNFLVRDDYRQGAYYRGNWYIAQQKDGAGTSSGVIRFSANDPALNATENILTPGTKYKELSSPKHNVGIATDDAGNIFLRYGSFFGNYGAGSFAQGIILKAGRNADGSISWHSDPTDKNGNTHYVVDFSSLSFTDNLGQTWNGIGRCDYYSMSGDVFSEEGAILYVAPSKEQTVYRIKLKSGDNVQDANGNDIGVVTAKEIDAFTISGSSSVTGDPFIFGEENYAFGVDGRDDYIFNLRSNGYFNLGLGKTQDDPYGKQVAIYESRSRINNAGGCTLQFNGELFIVTPMNQYSQNTGNFYVGIGTRKAVSEENGKVVYEGPEGADLANVVPIATMVQDDMSDAKYNNANGVWLYAELGRMDGTELWPMKTITLATDAEGNATETVTITEENIQQYAECMYIYQYVPGVRFAKYRITASNTFPTPEVSINVFPIYKDANGNELHRDTESGAVPEDAIELDRFDAVVSFPLIQGYGTAGADNAYEIEKYQLTLFDKYGNVVYPAEGEDADGEVDGVINLPHNDRATTYSVLYKDLDRSEANSYIAQVVTIFKGASGNNVGKTHQSAPAIAEDDNTYVPMAPAGQAVVYRSLQWSDWDADYTGKPSFDAEGNPVLPDKADAYWDVYQVAMNIQVPDFTQTGKKEPVSYYTIHVAKTNDGKEYVGRYAVDEDVESDYIKDIMLYVGKGESLDGVDADENGYVDCGALYGGKIPGTHEFKNVEGAPKNTPDVYWFEKYYMGYYAGEAGTEYEIKTPDQVNDRKYYVVAHYAAGTPKKITEIATLSTEGNSKIYAQRHAELTAAVQHENLPTGVENIELTANISVYPVPATVSITIKCAEAIESVEIYSLSGVKVKEIAGEGEQIMTVAVDDMEAGYYMLRVNDNAPIKVLKK